jgi:predicted membrane-bound mannosyltransferase
MKYEQVDHPLNPEPAINSEGRDWFWIGTCTAITALAAALRFADLALKPLHHDEGVNGFFLTDLFRKGVYHYDPANYHGPTLYYIALVFAKLFGLETVPVRASVAFWGVLTVVLCFYLRPYIGRAGSLFAGLFITLSPGMVFISRYFIHEIFFVFLSLAIVVSIVFFIEQRRAGPLSIAWLAIILLTCFLPSTLTFASYLGGDSATRLWIMRAVFFLVEAALVFFVIRMLLAWNEGRPIYFLLAAACVALLFATKETAFITIGTMLIACLCVWVWTRLYKPTGELGAVETDDSKSEIDDSQLTAQNFINAVGDGTDRLLLIVASAALIIYLIVLFFSSFFTYAEGVRGFYEAYSIWTKTGSKDHTQNGMWAYLRWGLADPSARKMGMEAPVFVLSAIGTLFAFLKARHRFAMFVGLWALGLFAAYTLIPYKTPWLALSFLLPMCIISGYLIGQFAEGKSNQSRFAAVGLGTIAAALMAYQTYELNFVHYADNDMPYVYAHTEKEIIGRWFGI